MRITLQLILKILLSRRAKEAILDRAIQTSLEERKVIMLESNSRSTRHLDGVLTGKCTLPVAMDGVLHSKSLRKRESQSTIKYRLSSAKETSVVSYLSIQML